MSDLQCPAVFLFIPREAAASIDDAALAGKRLSGVFVVGSIASMPSGVEAATRLASEAGCPIDNLVDAVDGATLARAVDELADLHRGETFAVVASADAIRDAFGHARAPDGVVAVAIDASGWSLRL